MIKVNNYSQKPTEGFAAPESKFLYELDEKSGEKDLFTKEHDNSPSQNVFSVRVNAINVHDAPETSGDSYKKDNSKVPTYTIPYFLWTALMKRPLFWFITTLVVSGIIIGVTFSQIQLAKKGDDLVFYSPSFPPTTAPTVVSSDLPSSSPTDSSSSAPTIIPTDSPLSAPTIIPTDSPLSAPTIIPTDSPSSAPTIIPTDSPSSAPTIIPTDSPSSAPTIIPTDSPSPAPTIIPTDSPSSAPTIIPTDSPSSAPTFIPTDSPSPAPTFIPTSAPTSAVMADLSQETIALIQESLSNDEERYGAYLSSHIINQALNLSVNGQADANAVIRVHENSMRMVECAYHISGQNRTAAVSILSAALYASILDDAGARAFLKFSTIPVDAIISIKTNKSDYANSCLSVSSEVVRTSVTGNSSSLSRPSALSRRLLSSTSCVSNPSTPTNNKKEVDIYFVNGILCTMQDATEALQELYTLAESLSIPSDRVLNDVAVIYNPTNGIMDFFETIQLKSGECKHSGSVTLRSVLLYFISKVTSGADVALNLDCIYNAVNDVAESLGSSALDYTENGVSASIAAAIRGSITHGRGVVVVPHSQGNLYVNIAYSKLTANEKQYVKILSIATPSSYVGDPSVIVDVNGPYVTRDNDWIIGPLRSSLPGNVYDYSDSWRCCNSAGLILNHEFLGAYLRDVKVRQVIAAKLQTAITNVPIPSALAGTGDITITLTWTYNADVDLHVIEPDGSHVYYANMRGTYGYLDRDDTTTTGPENYFSCIANGAAGGVYTVGVNYYYGFPTQCAQIAIDTETTTQWASVLLTQSFGYYGDNSPIPVATVYLSLGSNGVYDYSINILSQTC